MPEFIIAAKTIAALGALDPKYSFHKKTSFITNAFIG